ncbi:MAG: hypothetical protein KJO42_07155 [Silicimonas sp.]|nr:hypothetical protein [Silicimonas sp.]MBT8424153.1 hypothetical protein [Silicimonas sp.]NND17035.1 hypothetical protein [Silicimonas sp.]NNF92361.1 hypothetical protein [Boseongicola sp.]NNL35369.1 hypothetical protein [Silicimonas sp.]
MRLGVVLLLLSLPSLALAQTRLSPQEFESRVTGKTLTYSSGGAAYGAEEYLENRRVRWSFLDGECQEGRWYVAQEQICFVYENIPGPQCWQFFSSGSRLMARFENDPTQTELYETARADEPLMCLGPKVGV